MARIAINGLGRIGRAALKILHDTPDLELVAVNDIASAENIVYLLKYDTVYGRYKHHVTLEGDALTIEGRRYRLLNEKDPSRLPWGDLKVDIVMECTGVFTRRDDLLKHVQAGARNVILSAPPKGDDVAMVIHAVSPRTDPPQILSCASCTTNCITPVIEIMDRRIGVRKAVMTTIHAYTAGQSMVDGPNKRMSRGRAGAANFVPTSTGAARATTRVLPHLEGLFDGMAVRGPVAVGSLADITFLAKRATSVPEVNDLFRQEAASQRYRNILGVTQDPIVSSDIIQDPRASIVDLGQTMVIAGDLVKILSWYDNEWGFTCQMVRQAQDIARAAKERL